MENKSEIGRLLGKLGLSASEIDVYLASLELGESPITPIATRAGLPRTTAYYILERLAENKLVEILNPTSRRIYVPNPPRQILTLLENRKNKLEEEIDAVRESLPELLRLYDTSPYQPRIRVFRNQEIRQIYEDILTSGEEELLYVGENKKLFAALGERYTYDWVKRRIRIGMRTRAIRVENEEIDSPLLTSSARNRRDVRFPPADFQSPTNVLIYGNNLGFLSTGGENFGVLITSSEFAASMRSWFEQVWKVSREA